jgi:hypothetical protein
MKGRLPLVLSITAVVIAVAGFTSLGEAARDALPRASFARNADKVDGIHASRRPRGRYLLALGRNRKFPASVIPAITPSGLRALEILSTASAEDSSSPKTVLVNCPAGKVVVAGGARATGTGASEVGVSEFYPSTATQWTALAREINGTGSSWRLTAYAFCAIAT